LKRIFDIFFSGLGLIISFPLCIIISLIVKLTSQGKVFFRQTRVGFNRKEFILIKFRTMHARQDKEGLFVTARNDDRITVIGKILRRSKLDELPELWNVFKGDMSLVGPRPEVPTFVETYKAEWEPVFSVRPGITDLATLQFRDEENVLRFAEDKNKVYLEIVIPLKMKLSLEYVEKRSFWFDVKILFLTVWGITFGRFLGKPKDDRAEWAKQLILNQKNQNL